LNAIWGSVCSPLTFPPRTPGYQSPSLARFDIGSAMSKRRRPVTYLCPNSGDNREKYLGKPAHTNSMAGLQAVQWRRRCSETAMSASAAYSGIRSTSACAAQPVPSAKSSSHRLEAKIRAYPPKRCTPRLSNTCPCHKQGFVYLKNPRFGSGDYRHGTASNGSTR
jgi:hypothetical protein